MKGGESIRGFYGSVAPSVEAQENARAAMRLNLVHRLDLPSVKKEETRRGADKWQYITKHVARWNWKA